jgi:putative transposase
VAEEYSTAVSFIGEEKTSSKCPIHGDGCGKRGLFKCKRLKKVFNADLVAAYNILITPSSERDRGNWPETRPGIESQTGDVIPNFSTPAATFAI